MSNRCSDVPQYLASALALKSKVIPSQSTSAALVPKNSVSIWHFDQTTCPVSMNTRNLGIRLGAVVSARLLSSACPWSGLFHPTRLR